MHLSSVEFSNKAHFPERASANHSQRLEVCLRKPLPPLSDVGQALEGQKVFYFVSSIFVVVVCVRLFLVCCFEMVG